jgi:hypothetical protein
MKREKCIRAGFFQTLGVGLLAASAACAQTLDASTATFSDHGAGLRVDRSMLAAPRAESPGVVLPEALPAAAETYQMNLIGGSTVLLETARITSDGRYVRPRLTVGSESAELKSWMKSAGIQAERCMLPVVRARMRRDEATGDIGTAFWVSARCKFY